jgi:phospholipid transport system substrate-binding protein
LQAILTQRFDYRALSRGMLGTPWDSFQPLQQDAFVQEFSDYLLGVYLPLMDDYRGQPVRVTEEFATGKAADRTVVVRVTDARGERQIALVACRMRPISGQWRVVDVNIEGISVVYIFGAQFRPVMAKAGIEGLISQMRAKRASVSQ